MASKLPGAWPSIPQCWVRNIYRVSDSPQEQDKSLRQVTYCAAYTGVPIFIIGIIVMIVMLASAASQPAPKRNDATASDPRGAMRTGGIIAGVIGTLGLLGIVGARWHMQSTQMAFKQSGLSKDQYIARETGLRQVGATEDIAGSIAGVGIGALATR